MAKIIFLYALGLALAWAGLASLLSGWTAWPQRGAAVPAVAGLLALAAAGRVFLALTRLYRSPAEKPPPFRF